ncbi:MAG: hypothetical protein V4651_11325, partial [Bacteroidota bacterium]
MPDPREKVLNTSFFGEHEYPRQITGDGAHKIYLATTERTLAILADDTLLRKMQIADSVHIITSVCNELYYDSSRHELIVAYSHGCRKVSESNGKVLQHLRGSKGATIRNDTLFTVMNYALFMNPDKVPGAAVTTPNLYTVFADNTGRLWVGADRGLLLHRNGCWRCDQASMRQTPDSCFEQVFPRQINVRVNAINQLDNGSLVLATLGKGVFVIRQGKISEVSLGTPQQNMVNDLAVHGNIAWAATEKGLVRIDFSDYP